MSEKPPLTDSEIYDRLHEAYLLFNKQTGESSFGGNTIKAARLALLSLQAAMVKKSEDAKDQTQP